MFDVNTLEYNVSVWVEHESNFFLKIYQNYLEFSLLPFIYTYEKKGSNFLNFSLVLYKDSAYVLVHKMLLVAVPL